MIKKLARHFKEYKKYAILTPTVITIESILDMLIPFLMAFLIDKGIEAGDKGVVLKYGLILLVIAVCVMTLGILGGKFSAKASTGLAKNLRKAMYHKVQTYSFENIDKFSTASIITRHTTDVNNIQMATQMIIRIATRAPATLIASLVMSFVISPKLALIFLVAIPFLTLGLYFIITHAHPLFEKTFKIYDKLNNLVEENIRGIRAVKSFVTEDKEIKKFNNVSGDIYQNFSKAEKIVALNNPLMQFCVHAVMILLAYIGGKAIISQTLTTGELTSMISYAMQILTALMMLSMAFVMILISRASAKRVVELLDEESTLKNCENPEHIVKDGSISFENVSFSYVNDKNKLCLKDINLEIKTGETVGIIGGTGSSKSTLVQLIPRLYDATSGIVKVGGLDVKKYDLDALRNQVAMVLQKNVLFSGTIKENLRWGNKDATDEELIQACKHAQAHDFIMRFPNGYDTYLEEGGSNVSGGQKQRICIARALLKKTKILILDDSTSAVDTKTESLIRKAFKEDMPETTKIIIAQRISSVQDADKIIVLNNGTIDGIGTHEELLKSNEIYSEVYNSQVKGGSIDG